MGITETDGSAVTTAPYTGDIALVYNANTDNEGNDETGYVANVEPSQVRSLSIDMSGSTDFLPEIYPMDVQFSPNGRIKVRDEIPEDRRRDELIDGLNKR